MTTALYDLRYRAAAFDFFIWLLHVQAKGATEIVINPELPPYVDGDRWTPTQQRMRRDSIVLPGAALAALPSRLGTDGEDFGSHKPRDLWAVLQPRWRRLHAPVPPSFESPKFTVTLRNTNKRPNRNSDRAVWLRFAKMINAYVIDDYEIDPIPLHRRMTLYAGATMNFGVNNGPMALLFFTPYPVMMFDCQNDAHAMTKMYGIANGAQLPISLPHQRMIWQPPSVKLLMREFDAWYAYSVSTR